MRQFAVIMLLACGFATEAGAQSFLNELRERKSGLGTVTVTQSQDIDELVNNAKLAIPQQSTAPMSQGGVRPSTPTKPEKPDEAVSKTADESSVSSRLPEARHEAEVTSPSVNTSKKVLRNARKITGYRVQAFSGGNSRADRQKAESIGNAIKSRFPDLPIYVHFYSPRWICRVGNFRTYGEANEVLQEIKNMGYRQACIVKGKITVAY